MPQFLRTRSGSGTLAACMVLGFSSLMALTALAQVPTDPGTWSEMRKLPFELACIGLAGLSMWLAFRHADKSIIAQNNLADAMRETARLLAERPCIRNPQND